MVHGPLWSFSFGDESSRCLPWFCILPFWSLSTNFILTLCLNWGMSEMKKENNYTYLIIGNLIVNVWVLSWRESTEQRLVLWRKKLKKASAGKGWPRVNCERWEEFGQVRKNEWGERGEGEEHEWWGGLACGKKLSIQSPGWLISNSTLVPALIFWALL